MDKKEEERVALLTYLMFFHRKRLSESDSRVYHSEILSW
jgi:hypothetical protein